MDKNKQYNPMEVISKARNPGFNNSPPSNMNFLKNATPEERMKRVEHIKNEFYDKSLAELQFLAAYEMARVNQFIPVTFSAAKTGGLNETSERLNLVEFEPGYMYVITSITAYESADTPQIKIGFRKKYSNEDVIVKIVTIGNAEDSANWDGTLILQASDRIFAIFESATAADTINLNVHGYRIRL